MGKGFGFVATCLIGTAAGIAAGIAFPAGLVGVGAGLAARIVTGSAVAAVGTYITTSKFAEIGVKEEN
jgi:hypothetical protein